MVDNLCRGSRCGGVCREVPVGDLCPGRADGREFGATDVARGLYGPAVGEAIRKARIDAIASARA